MTKAAFISFGLAALLYLPGIALAQDNAAMGAATSEAVKRQADTLVLRQKLMDARGEAQRGDAVATAKLYLEACGLAEQIGPASIPEETTQAVAGLTAARLALARDAQSRGDLQDAQTQIELIQNEERILKVAPDVNDVLAFKKHNEQLIELNKGRIPSAAAVDKAQQMSGDKTLSMTLVQDGKLFYEMGKFNEAEIKLNQAIQLDPDNSTASYYLDLIKQDQIRRDMANHTTDTQDRMRHVEKEWTLPINSANRVRFTSDTADIGSPNAYATNQIVQTGPGRQAIMGKLNRIHLDSVSFDGLPLSVVIDQLGKQCRAHDPGGNGINFLINNNRDESGYPGPGPRISTTGGVGGANGFGTTTGQAATGRGAAGLGRIDPSTGLPEAAPAEAETENADIGTYLVHIPNLSDVRLADVLDAIVLVSEKPIKYSIEDFAIVFSPKNPQGEHLFMRKYRVDPNTFWSGLESVGSIPFASAFQNNSSGGTGGGGGTSGGGGGGGGNSQGQSAVVGVVNAFRGAGQNRASTGGAGGATTTTTGQNGGANGGATGSAVDSFDPGEGLLGVSIKTHAATFSYLAAQFFATLGIDWQNPPGKALFFNDRLGYLFVRSTESDLDTIESAVQVLNQVPPQVHIKARFIEVSQEDNSALGFAWTLGQFSLGNQVVGTGGSSPSLSVPSSAANPLGYFPGNTTATLIPGSASDQILSSGLGSSYPTLATFTGILTDPNFRVALQALSTRTGVENLGEPEITTISGRQTQMRATEIVNVVTGFSVSQQNTGTEGTATGSSGLNAIITPQAEAVEPSTQPIETGPILDVVPYVLSDGYTINLALIPSDTEFVGYQQIPAGAIPGYTPGAGVGNLNAFTLPVALPSFTVRQLVTTVNVWDNQTVVLGGLITSQVNNSKNKVPMLADIPLVGRLFTSESNDTKKNNLMIFVTSTIVDPAGNRVHSDDQLPFAQNSAPPQPSDNIAPVESTKTLYSEPAK